MKGKLIPAKIEKEMDEKLLCMRFSSFSGRNSSFLPQVPQHVDKDPVERRKVKETLGILAVLGTLAAEFSAGLSTVTENFLRYSLYAKACVWE